MKLETKAFLIMFAGSVMFFLSTMLPVMYLVDDKILKLHDINWFVQFAIALVFVSALIAAMSVSMMDTDKDKRLVQLKLAIYDGQNFILYWNPVGWLIWLVLKAGEVIVIAYLIVRALFRYKEWRRRRKSRHG